MHAGSGPELDNVSSGPFSVSIETCSWRVFIILTLKSLRWWVGGGWVYFGL